MAVTQYVGARYVPLFAEPLDWNDQIEYEPLTIVYYAGNSYTSRQHVPKGIQIANTDYWALTGNYNAQIEQYRQEVQTFDGRITANATAIEQADEDIQKNATDIASANISIQKNASDIVAANAAIQKNASDIVAANAAIQKNATDIESANAAIQENTEAIEQIDLDMSAYMLRTYAGKTVITIGDSIMLGTGTTDPDEYGMHARIAALLDATVYNYAENNAGFTTQGSGSRQANYYAQLQAAHSDHPYADLVIISGGCNDATVSNDVYAAAKQCFNYAKANFTKADVFVAPFQYGACQGQNNIPLGNNGRNLTVISDIQRAALESGIKLINHCWEMMVGRSDLLSDDIHPNDQGALVQAAKVVMGVHGCDYRPTYKGTVSTEHGAQATQFMCNCNDGIVTIAGIIKCTQEISGFAQTLVTLPAWASRGINQMIGAINGNGWGFSGIFQAGTAVQNTSTITANTDLYVQQYSFPLGM